MGDSGGEDPLERVNPVVDRASQQTTVRVTVSIASPLDEILVAELSALGFYAFEHGEGTISGYAKPGEWRDTERRHILKWLEERVNRVEVVEDYIDDINWNASWEQSITPVAAGRFVVVPSWKTVPDEYSDRVPIVVDPKMSFGTGHHETTRLMLELISDLEFGDRRVLDAGTGTGVLAIAASILGASHVVGFDNDVWSYENAVENLERNSIGNVSILRGSIEVVDEDPFDVILANIVRGVIESFMPDFRRLIADSGDMVLSGLLREDVQMTIEVAVANGFSVIDGLDEGEWTGLHLRVTE